jgi:hypothetical protein
MEYGRGMARRGTVLRQTVGWLALPRRAAHSGATTCCSGAESMATSGRGRMASEETERESKPKDAGNKHTRSLSPSSAHKRQQSGSGLQQQHPPAPSQLRWEQPHVVSSIGGHNDQFLSSTVRRGVPARASSGGRSPCGKLTWCYNR